MYHCIVLLHIEIVKDLPSQPQDLHFCFQAFIEGGARNIHHTAKHHVKRYGLKRCSNAPSQQETGTYRFLFPWHRPFSPWSLRHSMLSSMPWQRFIGAQLPFGWFSGALANPTRCIFVHDGRRPLLHSVRNLQILA